MAKIITSVYFKRELKTLSKKYVSILNDLEVLLDSLVLNPIQGTPIGDSCYKISLAVTSKGKGKSGGARVITNVKVIDDTVILLSIYDKSEQESISNIELKKRLEDL